MLRAQTGEAGFARVEAIRQTAIRFRRADRATTRRRCAAELAALLNDLPIAQTLARRARVLLLLAPREHRRGRPPEPPPARARAGRIAAAAGQPRRRARPRRARTASTRDALVALVRRRAGEPGAHRASDRGAAQEHPRLRARDRAAAAVARPHRRSRPTRAAEFETGLLPAGAGAVADGDAPAVEAQGARRDRQRPRVLPLHVPGRAAAALPVRSRRGSRAQFGVDATSRCRRSCAWARGSAATATAIRSSSPRRCEYAIRAQAARRVRRTTSTPSTRWAASCRCRRGWCSRRPSCWRSPPTRTTRIRTAQDEPYRQALIGIYARARRHGARRSPAARPRARRTASCRRTRRRTSSAPTSRTIDASLAAHGAALAGDAAGCAPLHARRRGVRLPPRVARPAPERRRARGGRRRAARARRRRRRLRSRCRRPSASRCSRASSPRRGRCIRRISRTRERTRSELAILARRGRHPSPLRRRGAAELRDLEVRSRSPTCSRSRVLLKEVGLLRGERARASTSCRCSRRSTTSSAAARSCATAFALPLLPALARGPRRLAGSDARLLRQQQGRRLPHRQLGAVPRRDARWSTRSARTASGCGSSTAAAARSAAAAGRATRRSSRSRPAASPAGCASPSRARSSPASIPIPSSAGATSRRWSRRRWRRASLDAEQLGDRAPQLPRGDGRAVGDRAIAAYRALVYETPGFVDYFRARDADRRDRRAQHRQPAGVAHGVDAHRGPARDSVGVQLGPVPADAAGLVRLRHGGRRAGSRAGGARRARAAARDARDAGRSSAACCRTWRWCSRRPTSRSRRATPSWSPTPPCANAIFGAHRRRARPHGRARCSRSPAHASLLDDNPTLARSIRNRFPYLDPLNHLQVELLRRYRAGQTDERTQARDPPHDQRPRRRPAQQRLRCDVAARGRHGGLRRSNQMRIFAFVLTTGGAASAILGASLPTREGSSPMNRPAITPRVRSRSRAARRAAAGAGPPRRRRAGPQPLLGPPLPDRRGALRQLHQGHRHQDQPDRGRRRAAGRAAEERRRGEPRRRAADRRCRAPVAGAAAGPVPAGEVGGAGGADSREVSRPGRQLVRLLVPRARDRLQQGDGRAAPTSRRTKSLADPKNKGRVCTRSGSHPYNLSLIGSRDRAPRRRQGRGVGEGRGRQHGAHAEGRRHRPDQGGGRGRVRDRAVEHLLLRAPHALDAAGGPRDRRRRPGVVFPDQASYGTHVNISGAGVLKNAPHKENAHQVPRVPREQRRAALFRRRQQRMAGGGVRQGRRTRRSTRSARSRSIRCPSRRYGKNTADAQKLADRAGWK